MRNPYIGPRAFRSGERLPARGQESRELTDLLIAERIVLLHAPSGAGKTSLIQAGLTPLLRAERLGEKHFEPTVPLRVKTPVPAGRNVHNRYVYSVALDLLRGRDSVELESLTLPEVLAAAAPPTDTEIPVLVFDQFEEILILNPADRSGQRMFFEELGAVLADGLVWALLAMREDYLGGLDRYTHNFPDHLRTTYRLDFLDTDAARVAIQEPAEDQGVRFADHAADDLLRRLTRVKIHRPGKGTEEVEAPYVLPFQLQIVCRQLWKSVVRRRGKTVSSIEADDIERYGNVNRALRAYYADAVAEVARADGTDVRAIREWCETQLITPERYRSQTLTGPASVSGAGDPRQVMLALTDAYLLSSDTRAGVTWYELSHDQLIQPILADNVAWRRRYLEPWQVTAQEWRSSRREELLLTGAELRAARHGARTAMLTEWDQAFLDECVRVEWQHGLTRRARNWVSTLRVLVVVQFLVIVLLIAVLRCRG